MQLHLFHNFIVRRHRQDGTPVFWVQKTNEWVEDHKQATRFDDGELIECNLPVEAEEVVTYSHPNEVIITVDRMRRAS